MAKYGKIQLEFSLTQDLNLLRLDQNVDSFHRWLSEKHQDGLDILHQQFGYPGDGAENEPHDHVRLRDSIGAKDRTLLKYIKEYGYDGYTIDKMENADKGRGDFHAEIGVYSPESLEKNLISKHSNEEIQELNKEAKLKKPVKSSASSRELSGGGRILF